MPIMTATEARKNLYRLIDEVSDSHEPVHISGKRRNAVLLSEEDWCCVQETLNLLSTEGMRDTLIEGLRTPIDQCEETLEWETETQ